MAVFAYSENRTAPLRQAAQIHGRAIRRAIVGHLLELAMSGIACSKDDAGRNPGPQDCDSLRASHIEVTIPALILSRAVAVANRPD
jgi:hypothetical protein